MRQIIYGLICLLQDPRFVTYDKATDKWTLNEAALDAHLDKIAKAGAKGIRLIPWDPWHEHPYGLSSQFQPYQMNATRTKYDLSKFNTWYFPIAHRAIEIAKNNGMTTWWCWFDNCQFHGPKPGKPGNYTKWSPWVVNVNGFSTLYTKKAYTYAKTWIKSCYDEFNGLGVAWSWGNEMTNAGFVDLAKAVIFPLVKELKLNPRLMTYGAQMITAPYINGEYIEDTSTAQERLKKFVGTILGDAIKLGMWREVHGIGGAGYPAVPNNFHQAITWWARKKNNKLRIWVSDDGTPDGESLCDVEVDTTKIPPQICRRPSATRWAKMVMATKGFGNDFTYEHMPNSLNVNCQVVTIKAIYKAINGVDPVAQYHYDQPRHLAVD